jgi:hypothetical protein
MKISKGTLTVTAQGVLSHSYCGATIEDFKSLVQEYIDSDMVESTPRLKSTTKASVVLFSKESNEIFVRVTWERKK